MHSQLYAVMKSNLTLREKMKVWFFLRAIRKQRIKIIEIDM